ncbi:MAG: c-type cytochrome [Acidobacteria bacterium]|nr:c-type cytochrome [Acidobacteriota bacterium]
MKPFFFAVLAALAAGLLSAPLGAQQRDTAFGQALFAANCAACHGSDGRGGERAPSIATVRSVIARSDAELEATVKNGLSGVGMPAFGFLGDQKIAGIVAYLRVLQGKGVSVKLTGSPADGRELFYGKAACAKCHMVRGEGGFYGADLTTYGGNLTTDAVRSAIVDPAANPDRASKVVEIETRAGQRISGHLRAEDNFNIAVQTEDGRFHMYSKSKLAGVKHTSRPIMPADYGSKLAGKEIDDLVSFLIANGSASPQAGARKGNNGHN